MKLTFPKSYREKDILNRRMETDFTSGIFNTWYQIEFSGVPLIDFFGIPKKVNIIEQKGPQVGYYTQSSVWTPRHFFLFQDSPC